MKVIQICFIFILTSITCASSNKEKDSADSNLAELPKGLIVSIFKQNRIDHFSDSAKNCLINNGVYYSPNNSEEEIWVCKMYVDSLNNTIRIEDYYEVGGGASSISEYKVIKTKTGSKLLYSNYGGTVAFTTQYEFDIYDYSLSTGMLTRDSSKSTLKQFKVDTKDFFVPNTPDSVIVEYESHSSHFYRVVDIQKGIAEHILIDGLMFDDMKNNKWIKGNSIRFDIIGDTFIRSLPSYEEE